MNTTNETQTETRGAQATQVAMVHKKDAEGLLMIDRLTGMVSPGQHERPDWAEGLVCAQLAEHALWLTRTFGQDFARQHAYPEMFAFEALGWLTFQDDGTGEGVEGYIDADAEFRMDVIATTLNIDRSQLDPTAAFAGVAGITTTVEISRDNTRTDAEMEDFRTAQEGRFDVIEGGKTGTHG